MNRDDIIRMAREAGFIKVMQVYEDGSEIVTVAPIEELTLFAKLVAAAEREACAKVCEERKHITPEWQLDQHYNQACGHCAAALRARLEGEP